MLVIRAEMHKTFVRIANREDLDQTSSETDFCRLLITSANCLDPDQDLQNVGPDLDPNRLTL